MPKSSWILPRGPTGTTHFFQILLVAFSADFFAGFFPDFFPGALAALRPVAPRTPLTPRTAGENVRYGSGGVGPDFARRLIAPRTAVVATRPTFPLGLLAKTPFARKIKSMVNP